MMIEDLSLLGYAVASTLYLFPINAGFRRIALLLVTITKSHSDLNNIRLEKGNGSTVHGDASIEQSTILDADRQW